MSITNIKDRRPVTGKFFWMCTCTSNMFRIDETGLVSCAHCNTPQSGFVKIREQTPEEREAADKARAEAQQAIADRFAQAPLGMARIGTLPNDTDHTQGD